MKFIYANYYYNFQFNVTCITSSYNDFNKRGRYLIKTPSHEWTKFSIERQTLSTLRSYDWDNAKGVGVVLGYNKLRALDIDGCNDINLITEFLNILKLPPDYSWLIESGSKNGFHILFYSENHNYDVAKNKIKAFKSSDKFKNKFKHIELRWIGHLVLPPSQHPSLMNYQFLNGFPLSEPSRIELRNLDVLLRRFCKGKSLQESQIIFLDDDEDEVSDASGSYIDDDEDEVSDASGSYIDDDEDEVSDASGSYIDDDEDEVSDASGSYIDDDEDEVSDASGSYIDDDEHEVSDASGSYIDDDEDEYYLFFDTETTGVPKDWNAPITNFSNWPRLVQLAWLLYDSNGKLILKNESVIKPIGFDIPKEASDVHGITTVYATKYGKNIKDVLSNFEEQCLKSKYLVAHNINFDSKVMGSEFLRNISRNPISKLELLCTMECATDYCKIEGFYGYKWPKLSELHIKLFGKDFEDAHDALADIEATARCFWEMRKLNLI
jgi:DNA polymerase III epsilon subunit-like protein